MIAITVMTVKHKSEDDEKKTSTGWARKGKPVQFYADDGLINSVDEWAKQQPGRALTRSEALRRLVDNSLEATLWNEAIEAAAEAAPESAAKIRKLKRGVGVVSGKGGKK